MSLFTVIPQGPFESKCRKQLSLSSCGWVLIRSGQFIITSGHPVDTVDQFLGCVGHPPPQEPQFDLPRITERDLQEVARAKKSTAGGLDGWAWNEIKAAEDNVNGGTIGST